MKVRSVRFCGDLRDVLVNETDSNVDIEVDLDDGRVFAATIFTLANIATIMKRYSVSGECLSGRYFYCPDMIIVSAYAEEVIKKAITHMVEVEGVLGPMRLLRDAADVGGDSA